MPTGIHHKKTKPEEIELHEMKYMKLATLKFNCQSQNTCERDEKRGELDI